MKLLKISIKGLALFKETLEIDFFTEQQVNENHKNKVNHLFHHIYTNTSLAFVGVNASGKTCALKVISFVIDLLNGDPVNNIKNMDILENSKKVTIETIFYDEKKIIYKLSTDIVSVEDIEMGVRYVIENERLQQKKITKIKSKKDLVVFDEENFKVRDRNAEFLKDDISIVISINKNKEFPCMDMMKFTDRNFLGLVGDFPHELLAFLDPTIEYIVFNRNTNAGILKFYDKPEIKIPDPSALEEYLSSGTIKGINTFIFAKLAWDRGGYLIVDELENHFNREIVLVLIRFFANKRINRKGATLVFSTHYPELLDEFDRNDCIYVVRNRGGIYVQKLNTILKRNDIKKSEVFKSDYLGGTAPSHDSYIALKKGIMIVDKE